MPCGVPARCIRTKPRTILADFDQGRTVRAQRISHRLRQVFGAGGANAVAAETLRQAHEIRALGLHADARDLAPVHLVHDFL